MSAREEAFEVVLGFVEDQSKQMTGNLDYFISGAKVCIPRTCFVDVLYSTQMAAIAQVWIQLYQKEKAKLYIYTNRNSTSEQIHQIWTFFNAEGELKIKVSLLLQKDGFTKFVVQPM